MSLAPNASTTMGQHSIAKLLFDRQSALSRPGQRSDGRVLALVVEGGAMRGVVSGGMVAALEQLGLRDCFDAVYGSSAGAIAGAYFLAGQAGYGTTIFYENINNRRFIDLRRLFFGKPAVSLEFLLDDVCLTQKPLKSERVLGSDIPLRIVAASLRKKGPALLSDFCDAAELFQALRASARIPYFAGAPVEFRGDRYLDASLYTSIPFRSAVADGATDIVALLTRPGGDSRSGPSWIDRHLVAPYLRKLDPDLATGYLDRGRQYRREMDTIARHAADGGVPRVLPIQIPSGISRVEQLETSRERLVAGATAGFRAVHAALGLPEPQVVEILTPYPDHRDQ